MKYKNLKQGQGFTFFDGGMVYVRCRGGIREGRGGPLIRFSGLDYAVKLYGQ